MIVTRNGYGVLCFPYCFHLNLINSNTYSSDNNDKFFLFFIFAGIRKAQQKFLCPELDKRVNKSCFLVARRVLRQTTVEKIDEGNQFNNQTFFSVFNDRIKYKLSKNITVVALAFINL